MYLYLLKVPLDEPFKAALVAESSYPNVALVPRKITIKSFRKLHEVPFKHRNEFLNLKKPLEGLQGTKGLLENLDEKHQPK